MKRAGKQKLTGAAKDADDYFAHLKREVTRHRRQQAKEVKPVKAFRLNVNGVEYLVAIL